MGVEEKKEKVEGLGWQPVSEGRDKGGGEGKARERAPNTQEYM